MKAIEIAAKLIEKGEPFFGAKDPRLAKLIQGEEALAKGKALARERAAKEVEPGKRCEICAALEKEANSRAWQGKRPLVDAALKEHPELAGTAAALEAIARRQPGLNPVLLRTGPSSWTL